MKLKSLSQIDSIRASGRILGDTLHTLEQMVEPGISLLDIDSECRRLLREAGARPAFLGYMGFPAAICLSVNEQVIHGIPSARRLRGGDIVSMDLGVDLDGFISDSAVTVPVGRVTDRVARLLQVTREALGHGIEAAHAGGRVHDVSRAIFRHVRQFNYGVVKPYCGHGVGFAVHEDPQVPNYVHPGPNPRLKPGLVIAIEPMINLGGDDVEVLEDDWTVVTTDHSLSAHFEHTIAILEDRTEILTLRSDAVEQRQGGAA